MCENELNKMEKTQRIQLSYGNKIHVANPADINVYKKQAKPGSVYVEFDVPSNVVFKGGAPGWGIVGGPGSLHDKCMRMKGLPGIIEIPKVSNIVVKGRK